MYRRIFIQKNDAHKRAIHSIENCSLICFRKITKTVEFLVFAAKNVESEKCIRDWKPCSNFVKPFF